MLRLRAREIRRAKLCLGRSPVTAGNLELPPVKMFDRRCLSPVALGYSFDGFLIFFSFSLIPWRKSVSTEIFSFAGEKLNGQKTPS